jgi:hypothetical protein
MRTRCRQEFKEGLEEIREALPALEEFVEHLLTCRADRRGGPGFRLPALTSRAPQVVDLIDGLNADPRVSDILCLLPSPVTSTAQG